MKHKFTLYGARMQLAAVFLSLPGLVGHGWTDRYVVPPGTPGVIAATPYNTWTNAATNIPAAVAAASAGETIWVSNGAYVLTASVDIAKGVTVSGYGGDPGAVIIDGGNYAGRATTNACFYLNHTNAQVRCMTITNGWGSPSRSYWGGAVEIQRGVLSNCWLIANRCPVYGGAVAVHDQNGSIINCRIVSNACSSAGGGFWFWKSGQIINSVVSGNSARSGGGGVAQGGLVENCEITGNWSTNPMNSSYGGGGLKTLLYTNHVIIRNCLVANNRTFSYGAGIYAGTDPGFTNFVENCTIVSNVVVGGSRDGIFVNAIGGVLVMRNTIVYHNGAQNWYVGSGAITGDYSCTTPIAGLAGTGNFTNAPDLAAMPAGNFRLAKTSPCIDAGANAVWMATARDLDGHRRVINQKVDLGCYEFVWQGTVMILR